MRRALVLAALAALLAPGQSLAARWAVGAAPDRFAAVAAQLPGARTLVPGRALLVTGARPEVKGAAYVRRIDGLTRRVAFANTEPFAARQWYLDQDRAWQYWAEAPDLARIRVAVIDSGIDFGHPEFAGRVVGGRSFVGAPWRRDTDGHGTFVAGLIAADPFNGLGIGGLAFNADLLVAKVVQADGAVSLEGEVNAITWAVRSGARVINLSLGGVRDPHDLRLDTFSTVERDAIAYAYSKGVVVVAAVGNGPDSPSTPWNFADWPAALPHVVGVAALKQNGAVPDFSNRDPLFVDLAAPGDGVFSTIPRNLVDTTHGGCDGEPYSDCGPVEFRQAIGTSFAAPQVSAAAALLLGQDPTLSADQVTWLLERSATDVNATTCRRCTPGRDGLTGWGRLNVYAALKLLERPESLPPPDAYEPNDDAGAQAHPFGASGAISATLDYWDDPTDVYSIRLARGETLVAHASSSLPIGRLVLWKPGTASVGVDRLTLGNRAAWSAASDGQERLTYRAPVAGTYFLQVKVAGPTRARPVYQLSVAKLRTPA